MRRLFSLVLALLVPATTQPPQNYYLYTPTAKEYLTALPELVRQAQAEDNNKYEYDSTAFKQIMSNELITNYSDLKSINFDTLYEATPYLNLDPYRPGLGSIYSWHYAVIDAWLRENNVDLSTKKEWQFRGYTLNITPIDLNGDGRPELIVEITFQPEDYPEYQEFMVMQRDNAAPGKYRAVSLPQGGFWYSAECSIHAGCGGGAQTFKIADINGDGLPEWLVAVHDCGYGECGGGLVVLGWRHGEMVDLAPGAWPNSLSWTGTAGGGGGPDLPPDGTWTFSTASSGQHQIIQRREFQDNRDCDVTYTTVLTWNKAKDRFIAGDLATNYADTAPCALRRGQDAFEEANYAAAVDAYKRAVELLPVSSESYAREALQYAQIRLVLAYALSQQPDQALALRDQVLSQAPDTATMGYLLNALRVYNADADRVQLCVALRQAVARYNPYFDGDKTDFFTFGQTDDVQDRGMYLGGDFGADSSGCDLGDLLKSLVGKLQLLPGQSHDSALSKLGIKPTQEFSADLNGDGKADWLFWLDGLPDQGILLLSANRHYDVSLPQVTIPGDKTQLTTIKLPGGATALASVRFGDLHVWASDDPEPCGTEHPFGSIDLLQVMPGNLQSTSNYPLCEPRSLAQIFPSPYKLQAWNVDSIYSAVETTFTWNVKDQAYDAPVAPEASESVLSQDCFIQPYQFCGLGSASTETLTQLDNTLSNPPSNASPGFLAATRYTRALLLQRAGNTSAALSDFVALYETAPSPAWKALAALHLRQANGAPLAR